MMTPKTFVINLSVEMGTTFWASAVGPKRFVAFNNVIKPKTKEKEYKI
jgi:hypothetical protein